MGAASQRPQCDSTALLIGAAKQLPKTTVQNVKTIATATQLCCLHQANQVAPLPAAALLVADLSPSLNLQIQTAIDTAREDCTTSLQLQLSKSIKSEGQPGQSFRSNQFSNFDCYKFDTPRTETTGIWKRQKRPSFCRAAWPRAFRRTSLGRARQRRS